MTTNRPLYRRARRREFDERSTADSPCVYDKVYSLRDKIIFMVGVALPGFDDHKQRVRDPLGIYANHAKTFHIAWQHWCYRHVGGLIH